MRAPLLFALVVLVLLLAVLLYRYWAAVAWLFAATWIIRSMRSTS